MKEGGKRIGGYRKEEDRKRGRRMGEEEKEDNELCEGRKRMRER